MRQVSAQSNSSSRTEKKLVCCQAEKKKQHHQLSLITLLYKIFFVSIESPAPLPLSPPVTPSPMGGVLLAWPLFWPGDIHRLRPSILFALSGALNHVPRKTLRVPHRAGAGRPFLLSSGNTWTKSTVLIPVNRPGRLDNAAAQQSTSRRRPVLSCRARTA